MKKIKNIAITAVLAITLIFSCYKIFHKFYDDEKSKDTYNELRALNDNSNDEDSKEETKEDLKEDLSGINEDFRFWISIDNTELEYPVVQAEDNDYYLKRDIYKKDSEAGSIFMDFRNNSTSYKNMIIYGHHMKNGTMFTPVTYYKNEDFWKKNNKIRIYSGPTEYVYEVYAVVVVDPEKLDYLITDFDTNKDFLSYVNKIRDKSIYKSDLKVTSDDEIITLSTCSYEFNNARTFIQGKLIKKS